MKLLYLSCHSVLEYDEVRLFHELGIDVFSPGALYNPQSEEFLRPGISTLHYNRQDIIDYDNLYVAGKDTKDVLSKDFVDRFDVIYIMDLMRWVDLNWENIKHKIVIFRTIGQNTPTKEKELEYYRQYPNFKIVRYSPHEKNIKNYCGGDAIIRFCKKPEEYKDWNGNINRVITICQSMVERSSACSWDIFKDVSLNFKCRLYGNENGHEESKQLWIGKKVTEEELRYALRDNRVYLYTGTKPACYTLNFIESWMTGIPVVAIGKNLGNERGFQTYEIEDLIENEHSGFFSDNIDDLNVYIKELLKSQTLSKLISTNGRAAANTIFNYNDKLKEWSEFYKKLNI